MKKIIPKFSRVKDVKFSTKVSKPNLFCKIELKAQLHENEAMFSKLIKANINRQSSLSRRHFKWLLT